MLICQSCGMNIDEDKHKGTNEDGTLSLEYCSYCFKKGKFTRDLSLNEQVEVGLNYSSEYKKAQTEAEKEVIRQKAKKYLSNLKRWQCTCTDECASGYNANCTCTNSECHCTDN